MLGKKCQNYPKVIYKIATILCCKQILIFTLGFIKKQFCREPNK